MDKDYANSTRSASPLGFKLHQEILRTINNFCDSNADAIRVEDVLLALIAVTASSIEHLGLTELQFQSYVATLVAKTKRKPSNTETK